MLTPVVVVGVYHVEITLATVIFLLFVFYYYPMSVSIGDSWGTVV